MTLFDRSWYNRGGVEPVMGFVTEEKYKRFLSDVPKFEKMLVQS
jgi:polyphosphate kinase